MPIDIKQLETSLRDSGALPYLISGGAGALAGGTAAAMTKRKREGKLARLGRILGTGLLTGASVAGAHKLLNYSKDTFANALPADDVSPEQTVMTGGVTRGIGGAIGVGGLAANQHRKDLNSLKSLSTLGPEYFGTSGNAPSRNYNIAQHAQKGANTFGNIVTDAEKKLGPTTSKNIDSVLRDLGISSKAGRFANTRNKVVPAITKFTGRTKGGVAARLAAIAAGTMYPEIISATGDAYNSAFPGDTPPAQ